MHFTRVSQHTCDFQDRVNHENDTVCCNDLYEHVFKNHFTHFFAFTSVQNGGTVRLHHVVYDSHYKHQNVILRYDFFH